MEEKNHIYPIFDRMMTRQDKEELLGQHSVMIWFTGLSGSGTVSYTHLDVYKRQVSYPIRLILIYSVMNTW